MLSALVHERGRGRVLDVVEPASHQREAFGGPVRHRYGVVELALEPGFDRVLVRRSHVGEVIGEQRAHVCRDYGIRDRRFGGL